jgi:hypothetical protein
MKSVVIFILAFIVATGGSAAAKVMLTKPASAPAGSASDSTDKGKDSTQTDTAIVASAAMVTTPAPDSPHTAAELPKQSTPVTTAPADSSKHAAAVNAPSPVAVPTPTSIANAPENPQVKALAARVGLAVAANDSATEVSERRVAKVFTSMDPKQAAKVLDRMADADVHIILGYVGPRQAASILAVLPPERVAKLSKLAMQGKK